MLRFGKNCGELTCLYLFCQFQLCCYSFFFSRKPDILFVVPIHFFGKLSYVIGKDTDLIFFIYFRCFCCCRLTIFAFGIVTHYFLELRDRLYGFSINNNMHYSQHKQHRSYAYQDSSCYRCHYRLPDIVPVIHNGSNCHSPSVADYWLKAYIIVAFAWKVACFFAH